ncbi:unnamed protein product [Durusdinium trenchii]|uniref:Ubiquitin-like domain-containing protein n=1 Tax=Durusdinium trenchii TaxID=1381693 RepID=A0ABP0R547_9DINO
MAMEVSFRQLNGEAMILEVMPDMTGRELKARIKECQLWDDELTRKTTRVDIVVGASRMLKNDETAAGAGLSPESEATVILRQNTVTCSNKRELAQLADNQNGTRPKSDRRHSESLFVVQITNGVTAIVQEAFWGCNLLASVTIPNSVTHIGSRAFADCSSLASVTIPDSVMEIGEAAFAGCSSLASVTIPSSVTQIGSNAFGKCSSLASVTIPDSVTQIGNGAFEECSSLASVTIPDSVTQIGMSAFAECSSLASVTIPNSVTQIGVGAFAGCRSLASVTIPDSVTHIGCGAFAGCRSLASVTIPDSVTQIGEAAFLRCSALTLVLPITRIRLEEEAFSGCQRIQAKECECQGCEYSWFLDGWVCPRRWRSSLHGRR